MARISAYTEHQGNAYFSPIYSKRHESNGNFYSKGKKLIFVTNNSTKSREAYAKKFHSLGLQDVQPNEIFGSAFATAFYLKNTVQLSSDKKVFVVGQQGIADELDSVGIRWSGAHEAQENYSMDDWDKIQPDPDVGIHLHCVVI